MDNQILFTTKSYRISSMRYFGVLFRNVMRDWWSILVLFAVALIAGVCYDVRFVIVLLMIIFLALPLLLFFLYYNYALRREAFYSVVDKSIMIHREGIDCEYNEQQREILRWKQVKRAEIHPDSIHLYTDKYTYFYISRDAFEEPEQLKLFEQTYLPQFIS